MVVHNTGSLEIIKDYLKSILNKKIPLTLSKIDHFTFFLRKMGFREKGFSSINDAITKARATPDSLAKEKALDQAQSEIKKYLNKFSEFLENSLFIKRIEDLFKS